MSDQPQTIPWRTQALERDLGQLRTELRENYLNRDQMKIDYIPREEHKRHAQARREWPMIAAALTCAGSGLASILHTILAH
jgi:hypothetical protein